LVELIIISALAVFLTRITQYAIVKTQQMQQEIDERRK
jgi:uncharacterized membrane protein